MFIGVGFSIMGPLPFFNLEKSIKLIIVALVFHGLGLGAEVVAGFADAHKSVRICQKFKIELKSLKSFCSCGIYMSKKIVRASSMDFSI